MQADLSHVLRRLCVHGALHVCRSDSIPDEHFVDSLREAKNVVQYIPSKELSYSTTEGWTVYLRPVPIHKSPKRRRCQDALNVLTIQVKEVCHRHNRLARIDRERRKSRPSRTNVSSSFTK